MEKELDVENLQLSSIVEFKYWLDSTFTIGKNIKIIKLTKCEYVNFMCESLISKFEIINCAGVKVQIINTIKASSIDGSDKVILHLNQNSKEA